MKSEWEFQFEARGFRFEREYKYTANPDGPIRLGDRPAESIECLVRIVPRDTEPPPYVDQVGSLFILLPYSYAETRNFALYVARMVADRITFQQGDFRIVSGLIACKRIAETPEEQEDFGDKLYNIEARLIEVIQPPAFDSASLMDTPATPHSLALMSQFNDTKRDGSAIRQFLGYFRILESIYHTTVERTTLKQVLIESSELREIHSSLANIGSYDALISELVEVRHKCAHLKLSKGFGYVPIDPTIEREVRPHLSLLAALVSCSIMRLESSQD